MTTETITPDALVDFLVQSEKVIQPSEFQGILHGLLSAGAQAEPAVLFATLAQELGIPADDPATELLQQHFDSAGAALHEADQIASQLMLPEDSAPLEERLDAVSGWSRGFLFGVVLSGLSEEKQQHAELSEVMDDLQQISQVGVDLGDETDEDQEAAYIDIVEYIQLIPTHFFLTCHQLG